MLLSRNYRLLVAWRKFDVLETNISCYMLVLKISNFQGATFWVIVPTRSIVFITGSASVQKLILNNFNTFRWNPSKPIVKFEKENREKFKLFIFLTLLVCRKILTEECYPSGYFSRRALWADSVHVFPRMNTIASRDQFKLI